MIVLQFARMQRENRLGLYCSTARAIKVAADELIIRRMLRPEAADVAVPVALDWPMRLRGWKQVSPRRPTRRERTTH